MFRFVSSDGGGAKLGSSPGSKPSGSRGNPSKIPSSSRCSVFRVWAVEVPSGVIWTS